MPAPTLARRLLIFESTCPTTASGAMLAAALRLKHPQRDETDQFDDEAGSL
jgi:hypothetical protein